VDRVVEAIGAGPHMDFNTFMSKVEKDAEQHNVKLISKRRKLLKDVLTKRDDQANEVIKRVHKKGVEADPIRGRFAKAIGGNEAIVEYEADSELRDSEQVPLLEEGGIETFIRREVLPYAADGWYDAETVKTGYEISFTRYFYKPQPLRTLEEIRDEILMLERESEGLLAQIIDGSLR
jgi:type I restriction enzyme M protein